MPAHATIGYLLRTDNKLKTGQVLLNNTLLANTLQTDRVVRSDFFSVSLFQEPQN